AAINSALQRGRETLGQKSGAWREAPVSVTPELRELLQRYVRAWETADLRGLVALLHEDATLAMPPIPVWLQGAAHLEASMRAMVFSSAKPGEFSAVETRANGRIA